MLAVRDANARVSVFTCARGWSLSHIWRVFAVTAPAAITINPLNDRTEHTEVPARPTAARHNSTPAARTYRDYVHRTARENGRARSAPVHERQKSPKHGKKTQKSLQPNPRDSARQSRRSNNSATSSRGGPAASRRTAHGSAPAQTADGRGEYRKRIHTKLMTRFHFCVHPANNCAKTLTIHVDQSSTSVLLNVLLSRFNLRAHMRHDDVWLALFCHRSYLIKTTHFSVKTTWT